MYRADNHFRSPIYGNAPSYPPATAKPKVVSIPVHFVRSASDDRRRASAAVNIQRAFRGFVVRKNVRIVRRIESEVDEIQRKLANDRDRDLIAREEKERLKINEMLMRLLFRLDSVRGVRDYRRRVIRRVIALQDTVDSISATQSKDQALEPTADQADDGVKPSEIVGHQVEDVETLETSDHQVVQEVETLETSGHQVVQEVETPETPGHQVVQEVETLETSDHQVVEEVETLETSDHQVVEEVETLETSGHQVVQEVETPGTSGHQVAEEEEDKVENLNNSDHQGVEQVDSVNEMEEFTAESKTVQASDQLEITHQDDDNGNEISTGSENEESVVREEGSARVGLSEVQEEGEKEEEAAIGETTEGVSGMKDVMERMVAENEKLKELVEKLCERSMQQCRLIGGLADRVGNLENIVEKMEKRRKKKRKSHR